MIMKNCNDQLELLLYGRYEEIKQNSKIQDYIWLEPITEVKDSKAKEILCHTSIELIKLIKTIDKKIKISSFFDYTFKELDFRIYVSDSGYLVCESKLNDDFVHIYENHECLDETYFYNFNIKTPKIMHNISGDLLLLIAYMVIETINKLNLEYSEKFNQIELLKLKLNNFFNIDQIEINSNNGRIYF